MADNIIADCVRFLHDIIIPPGMQLSRFSALFIMASEALSDIADSLLPETKSLLKAV